MNVAKATRCHLFSTLLLLNLFRFVHHGIFCQCSHIIIVRNTPRPTFWCSASWRAPNSGSLNSAADLSHFPDCGRVYTYYILHTFYFAAHPTHISKLIRTNVSMTHGTLAKCDHDGALLMIMGLFLGGGVVSCPIPYVLFLSL